jgi:hypothetical protein
MRVCVKNSLLRCGDSMCDTPIVFCIGSICRLNNWPEILPINR